jgi:formate dehydrogenase subunit gamma
MLYITDMKEKPRPIKHLPDEVKVREICARHGDKPDLLIEILHEIQENLGGIPRESVGIIAESVNLSRAEVHGVVSFYHDFRSEPAGRHVVKICRAESCQAMGGNALGPRAEYSLGCRWGETTADGKITLEAVYCLGNCALSPAVMVDDRLYGRVDARRLDQIIDGLRAEAAE